MINCLNNQIFQFWYLSESIKHIVTEKGSFQSLRLDRNYLMASDFIATLRYQSNHISCFNIQESEHIIH